MMRYVSWLIFELIIPVFIASILRAAFFAGAALLIG